ncbi:MAG: T9SS type A sorting domain-containing protein [Candidatus Aegiribacteria sp.]|nr:T9SS type A sorting domain-containing protein [Candidatus Aegiribacteria sp.]
MKPMILIVLLGALSAFAGQAVQSDWSGGPDISGPISSWSNYFLCADQVAWRPVEGQIALSSSPLVDCTETLIVEGFAKPYTAHCDDINGDGLMDIMVGAYEADQVRVWYGQENDEWEEQTVSSETDGCCGSDIADIDDDGDLDVLIATYTGGRLLLFLNDGGSSPQWEMQEIATGFPGAHYIEASDVDEDGDLDLVAAAAEADLVYWYRNDGGVPVQWQPLLISDSVFYPCRLHPVDIDQDGNMDVVCAAYGSTGGPSSVTVWYGSGGSEPVWIREDVDTSILGAHGIRAVDMDNDGDLELVSAAMSESRTFMYSNNGSGWTRSLIGIVAACAIVKPADMDGDGDWDIVVSSFGGGGVAWWENSNGGTVWTKWVVRDGGGSTSCVIPADIDNNGSLDVLAIRFMQNKVVWHTVTEFVSTGTLTSSVLDSQEAPQWASIDWDVSAPTGSSFSVQFRSSSDPGNMGDWSVEYCNPTAVSGLVDRYFQYRILLDSSDPEVSPVLRSFQFNWDPLGIEETQSPLSLSFPNPSAGSIPFSVKTGTGGSVALSVFDTSGRKVFSGAGETEAQFVVTSLPSGVYRAIATNNRGNRISRALVVLNR